MGSAVHKPRTQDVPPNPAAMIESMRAFGYSLPAAIADFVDNSITAEASRIDITIHWDGERSWIRVVDDGHGMDADELTNAMRLGSRSPREERDPGDLGRFGLGLKTAAFSQASALTVVSRTGDRAHELRSWDLEHVTQTGSWSLLLDQRPDDQPAVEAISNGGPGTAVLLKHLDRFVGTADVDDEHAKSHFLRQIESVEQHLGTVFHRFLGPKFAITVNGQRVEPWDPFLAENPATQELPAEHLPFRGEYVDVHGFVLPHHSMLSTEAHRRAGGIRGWNQHQGFYVYRARRLLVAGEWLGLPFQKEEHYKLARIQVDISNAMDLPWQIDVRKATARIPRELRDELRRIADATRRRAAEAYRYRGKRVARAANVDRSFVWSPRVHRGKVSYQIDREHPLVRDALESAGEMSQALERAFRVIEETLPIQSIIIETREHPDGDRAPFAGRQSELTHILRRAYGTMVDHGATHEDTLALLSRMEPFDAHPELVAALAEETQR